MYGADSERARAASPALGASSGPPSSSTSGAATEWPQDHSLYCFGPQNGFRVWCKGLIQNATFDKFIILTIIVSGVALALDAPRLDANSELAKGLRQLDEVILAVFVFEMLAKIVALGFIMGKNAYIKSAWNQIDFLIVVCSILVLLAEFMPQLRSLKVLRVMRILRPHAMTRTQHQAVVWHHLPQIFDNHHLVWPT